MSKITKIEGRRSDGIIITFDEKDIDKVQPQEFTSITVTELVSYEELKKLYPASQHIEQ